MKRILIFSFLTLAFVACHKDKVETMPHISFKSTNTDVVPPNSTLRVSLEFTDKEGDLDSLFVIRQRLNAKGPNYRVLPYSIPEFSGQTKGELQLTMNYQTDLVLNLNALRIPGSNPAQYEPDTMQFRFYVKDKAGNVSDSTAPKQIIVIR
jgi:hypothetical protein